MVCWSLCAANDEPTRTFVATLQKEGRKSWTPSTIFVVTDHLTQLLVENRLRCMLLAQGARRACGTVDGDPRIIVMVAFACKP